VTDVSLAGTRPAIREVDPELLTAWLAARGEPAYRAAQVMAGAHRPTASSLDDLTDLPSQLRSAVAESFRFSSIVASHTLVAD
jgi:adenine C2-methylase RlmN of 23S rRNA A2503 and tRNA A37